MNTINSVKMDYQKSRELEPCGNKAECSPTRKQCNQFKTEYMAIF